MLQLPKRLQSIDVFRAITMFFMIFVNDVDGVTKIPEWIKHVKAQTDGLGFADTVFPSFLFIVGLSIPFAFNKRIESDESRTSIVWHILVRSFALIVMGFFHVNMENYSDAALLPEPVFEILATLAFFLIWLDYKPSTNTNTKYILQAIGIGGLIFLAIIYKGERHGEVVWLRPYWWGILGLIGWGYLTCSLVYLFSKGKLPVLIVALILFVVYNILNQTSLFNSVQHALKYIWPINSGSEVSFIMSGIIISVLYKNNLKNKKSNFLIVLLFLSIIMISFGFLVRPFGGISKIHATPSWFGICSGISIFVFALLILIVDVKGKANCFNIIKPAGTSTLTCYLLPYFLYSFMEVLNINYPQFFNESIGGILRSFIVAFVVIFITGFLEKKHLRLKI
jgi:heparan-alpha-glucosaminide N-acetyltransferase